MAKDSFSALIARPLVLKGASLALSISAGFVTIRPSWAKIAPAAEWWESPWESSATQSPAASTSSMFREVQLVWSAMGSTSSPSPLTGAAGASTVAP